jgi:hypothetical protein
MQARKPMRVVLSAKKRGMRSFSAVEQVARDPKPSGIAILSDYKRKREYAAQLKQLGLSLGNGVEALSRRPLRSR